MKHYVKLKHMKSMLVRLIQVSILYGTMFAVLIIDLESLGGEPCGK
jgi:hypothetical protein